ncbi:helix-turn-helix domain-containing protein [Actinomadura violacea]|uniref:Helix-turn-helix transcriptional regulator n=1 Tax=Actinomadura violacea TaxID=2819934 RepID=A0ABS3S6T5_9ACTN|nr:helix-turn-helix transcriptional regulator [Actinomadura violacea]MBO2464463.1 helix-turn-helix transcriptional regulator [Actinomadura violacea]
MAWWEYVERVAKGDTQTAIAARIGLSQGGISGWRTKAPKPETVAAFARGYHRPVLEAFVAAGFLTADEAGITEAPATLADLSSAELLDELGRRLGVH